jgi:hypothetical protein
MARTIEQAVNASYAGYRATAIKRGRNPKWPYVPVFFSGSGGQQQIRGKAFATREEAIAYAERCIVGMRQSFARRLAEPRNRALRAQWEVA